MSSLPRSETPAEHKLISEGSRCYIPRISEEKMYNTLNRKVKEKFNNFGSFEIEFVNSIYHPELRPSMRRVVRQWCIDWNKPQSHNLHIATPNFNTDWRTVIEFKVFSNYEMTLPQLSPWEGSEFIVGELDNPSWSDPEDD
jgi:hypothetical protein